MLVVAGTALLLVLGLRLLMAVRRSAAAFYRARIPRSLIILVHMCYLNVATRCLEAVNCVAYPDGTSRLAREPSVVCYSNTPHLVAGIGSWVVLAFGVAGYPIGALVWLSRRRSRLGEKSIRDRAGTLIWWVAVCVG